jgi:DNA-damage-inducible protein J
MVVKKTDMLHIRIEPELKKRVENTLKALGLTTTDAINIFLSQVDLTGGIPFEVRLPKPKPELIAAMVEARRITKEGKGFSSVEELMKDLES